MILQKYTGEIPEIDRSGEHNKLQSIIDDFINMQTKYATVTFESDEYANVITAYRSMAKACAYSCKPVKVIYRQGIIFLIRTDT